jgi:hypothetical protein
MVPRWGTKAVRFLVLWMAGWIHSRQREVIDFLREENRLREQLSGRRYASPTTSGDAWVERRERLCGLLNFYYRLAR